MTRAAALLALSLAALAWLLRRPSRPDPGWDEPEDGVQPADPVTLTVGTPDWLRPPWTVTNAGYPVEASTDPDPTYLEAQAVAIRRGTQSGPLGPSA